MCVLKSDIGKTLDQWGKLNEPYFATSHSVGAPWAWAPSVKPCQVLQVRSRFLGGSRIQTNESKGLVFRPPFPKMINPSRELIWGAWVARRFLGRQQLSFSRCCPHPSLSLTLSFAIMCKMNRGGRFSHSHSTWAGAHTHKKKSPLWPAMPLLNRLLCT